MRLLKCFNDCYMGATRICRLEVIPCDRVKVCPIFESKEFGLKIGRLMKEILEVNSSPQKEEDYESKK